jgi:hypothetical protein
MRELDFSPSLMEQYLHDPLLHEMFEQVRGAGPVRSMQMDITHKCNIRCQGCYFFSEELDQFKAPDDEAEFDAFVEREKARGTNYVTVVGGEPSLMLGRLKKLYDNFWLVVVTNGIRKIPYEGFENLAIGCSVWGDHDTDTRLRGSGKIDVFQRALDNYKDDRRVVWYYTTTPGNAHEIEAVTEQCVANGNYMGYSFYGDIAHLGGAVDQKRGFGKVCDAIDRMIERYPDRVLHPWYVPKVVAEARLYDDIWGFDVCCTLSDDKPKNQERFNNGKPYNSHFRVYNPDLKSTRVCCRSDKYDCENCYDTWAHIAWIMTNLEKHLGSEGEFSNWLGTVFMFYLTNRIIDFERNVKLVPEIHERLAYWRRLDEMSSGAPLAAQTRTEDLLYEAL